MKVCKWCGKTYEACRTPNPEKVFRWRDVGCSLECASAYIELVEASRAGANNQPVQEEKVEYKAEVELLKSVGNEDVDAHEEADEPDYDLDEDFEEEDEELEEEELEEEIEDADDENLLEDAE